LERRYWDHLAGGLSSWGGKLDASACRSKKVQITVGGGTMMNVEGCDAAEKIEMIQSLGAAEKRYRGQKFRKKAARRLGEGACETGFERQGVVGSDQ